MASTDQSQSRLRPYDMSHDQLYQKFFEFSIQLKSLYQTQKPEWTPNIPLQTKHDQN